MDEVLGEESRVRVFLFFISKDGRGGGKCKYLFWISYKFFW